VAKKPAKRPNEDGGQHRNGGKRVLLGSSQFTLICEQYAETGLAYASCEALGFNYSTVMTAIKDQWNRGDETWQELWDESHAKFRESLERAIFQRGRDGTPTKWRVDPRTGDRTAIEWTFSDRLLELAARGHFPERYRDNVHVSGTVGLEPVDAFANLSTGAKRKIRAIIMEDLEEQRLAQVKRVKDSGVVVESTATEMLTDMRAGTEDDD
jgi:hypothetical protein